MLKVLIADDHLPVRLGVRLLVEEALGQCSTEFASNGTELFRFLKSQLFDLLITDLSMPNVDIMQLVPGVMAIQPSLKVLVLSVNSEAVFARRLLSSGAFGYLQKNASDTEIRDAIRHISKGKKYLSDSQIQNIHEILTEPQKNVFSQLSEREMEVAILLLKGYGPLEISNSLSVSASTASSFKARIFKKLNVSNLIEFSHLAQVNGIAEND
ncbi:response regulator [Pseudobacter ginsenosidimutans]|uniref:LuxR family two component transcriptional regulator n=1 Tax=Pseudobacter ginsenosidimutans TaxID=661488 RepID=A0A4Q7MZX4_9BACT|nr:response regulator transcription factor [Pseudobacter ginsenosidimutans]QEC43174.1 response regulator transcription factor [Pseudobacter ginsenosidimutans]RZS74533.1 LuxR family two component transcriptional regulator [Pseudobacter ginsenosidimutans]